MEASVEQVKQRARATWAAGDFDEISQMLLEVGRQLVGQLAIEPGKTVLDVACGTGNATIPAALAGGRCTGLDLTPELFDAARAHAAEADVEIEWVEGDAEALPFEDGSFDYVISTFGVMFAPRHEIAASELARVCTPGGTIGLACWTPRGLIGEMFQMVASRMPALPSAASPPVLWGSEDHVRSLLEPLGLAVVCEPHVASFRAQDAEAIVARKEAYFGPWRMAQAALGDDWQALRSDLVDLYSRHTQQAGPGTVEALADYLVTVAEKPVA